MKESGWTAASGLGSGKVEARLCRVVGLINLRKHEPQRPEAKYQSIRNISEIILIESAQ